ncbi:hypothetical protein [Streptococcus sp.]
MMKRTYSIVALGNERTDQMMILKLTDQKFQSLSNFLNSEVHNFYPDVREALEKVISGSMEEYAFDGNLLGIEVGKEITEVYFQFEEELLGEPCFIPTNVLYKLVLEWKEMEERMKRGEEIFPVTLED